MDPRNEKTPDEQEKMRHNLGVIAEAVDAGELQGISAKILVERGATASQAREVLEYLKNSGVLGRLLSSREGYAIRRSQLQELIDDGQAAHASPESERGVGAEPAIKEESVRNEEEIGSGHSAAHHGDAEDPESSAAIREADVRLRETTEREAAALRAKAAFGEGTENLRRGGLVADVVFAQEFNASLQEAFFENGPEVMEKLFGDLEACLRLIPANLESFTLELFSDDRITFAGEHSIALGVQALRENALAKTTKGLNELTAEVAKGQEETREEKELDAEREKFGRESLALESKLELLHVNVGVKEAILQARQTGDFFDNLRIALNLADPEIARALAMRRVFVVDGDRLSLDPNIEIGIERLTKSALQQTVQAIREKLKPAVEVPEKEHAPGPLPEEPVGSGSEIRSRSEAKKLEDWEMDLGRSLVVAVGFDAMRDSEEAIRKSLAMMAVQCETESFSRAYEQLMNVAPDPKLVAHWEAKYGKHEGVGVPESIDVKIARWEKIFGKCVIMSAAERWMNAGGAPRVEGLLQNIDEFVSLLASDVELLPTLKGYRLSIHGFDDNLTRPGVIDLSATKLMRDGSAEIAKFFDAKIREQEGLPPKLPEEKSDVWKTNFESWRKIFKTASASALSGGIFGAYGLGEEKFFDDMNALIGLLSADEKVGPLLSRYHLYVDDVNPCSTAEGSITVGSKDFANRGPKQLAEFFIENIRRQEGIQDDAPPSKPEGENPIEAFESLRNEINQRYQDYFYTRTVANAGSPEVMGVLRRLRDEVYPVVAPLVVPGSSLWVEISDRNQLSLRAFSGVPTITIDRNASSADIISHIRGVLDQHPEYKVDGAMAEGHEKPAETADLQVEKPPSLEEARKAYAEAYDEYVRSNFERREQVLGIGGDTAPVEAARARYDVALKDAAEAIRTDVENDGSVHGMRKRLEANKKIFEELVIAEEKRLLDMGVGEVPAQEQSRVKKIWLWYARLPRWKKVAISATVTTGVAAATGAVAGLGILLYAGRKVAAPVASSVMGFGTAVTFEAYDNTFGYEKTKEHQLDQLVRSRAEDISGNLDVMRLKYKDILEEQAKREIKRMWIKAAVAAAVGAGTAMELHHLFPGVHPDASHGGTPKEMSPVRRLEPTDKQSAFSKETPAPSPTHVAPPSSETNVPPPAQPIPIEQPHETIPPVGDQVKPAAPVEAAPKVPLLEPKPAAIETSPATVVAPSETPPIDVVHDLPLVDRSHEMVAVAPGIDADSLKDNMVSPSEIHGAFETDPDIDADSLKNFSFPKADFNDPLASVDKGGIAPLPDFPHPPVEVHHDLDTEPLARPGPPLVSSHELPRMHPPETVYPPGIEPPGTHVAVPPPPALPADHGNIHYGEPQPVTQPLPTGHEAVRGATHADASHVENQNAVPDAVKDSIAHWDGQDPIEATKIAHQIEDVSHLSPDARSDLLTSLALKVRAFGLVNVNMNDAEAVAHQIKDCLVAYPEAQRLGFHDYAEYAGMKDMDVGKLIEQVPPEEEWHSALRHSFFHRGAHIEELKNGRLHKVPLRFEHVRLAMALDRMQGNYSLKATTVGEALAAHPENVEQNLPAISRELAATLNRIR